MTLREYREQREKVEKYDRLLSIRTGMNEIANRAEVEEITKKMEEL